MASIFDTLMEQIGGAGLEKMAGALGADKNTTQQAAGTAVTALLGGLSRNAARPDGAAALATALERDHDGGMLENLTSQLGGGDTGAGEGILQHVLGAKTGRVQGAISQSSGLDRGQAGKLMAMLAPAVLGMLGKTRKEKGLDAGALAGLLGQESQALQSRQPEAAGLVGKLLDTDGDGDLDLQDLMKHGSGLLGKMFGGN